MFRPNATLPLVWVLLAAFAGCDASDVPGDRPSQNVLIVLVDTLRADHLGAYGYHRPTSRHFDEFAASAILFENARAQAPCTFPSVNSLLTSRDPISFVARGGGRFHIPLEVPSLADLLSEQGYLTAAVSASPIVRRTPSAHNRLGGFESAFERFDEACLFKSARCVNARAFELIDQTMGRPFFLYLHYFDPHAPYWPPKQHERRFATEHEGNLGVVRGDPNPVERWRYGYGPKPEDVAAALVHLADLYDEEIAYFDEQFQMLLDGLVKRALLDRTIVVFVSDHGEAFMEDGDVKHCHGLGESQIRTPLVLHLPGVEGGMRIASASENLDVVPTVLDYLGIEVKAATSARFEGRSLRSSIEGAEDGEQMAFSSWRAKRSVVRGHYKLVYDLSSEKHELYDVSVDPFQRVDLSHEQSDVAATLLKALKARFTRLEGNRQRSIEAGDAAIEQLKALGYLE